MLDPDSATANELPEGYQVAVRMRVLWRLTSLDDRPWPHRADEWMDDEV